MKITLQTTQPIDNQSAKQNAVAKKFPEFNLSTTQGKRNVAILVSVACIAAAVIFGGIAAIASKLMVGSVIAIGISALIASNPITATILAIAAVVGILGFYGVIGVMGFVVGRTIIDAESQKKSIEITPEFLEEMQRQYGPDIMEIAKVNYEIEFMLILNSLKRQYGGPGTSMLELQNSLEKLEALADHLRKTTK